MATGLLRFLALACLALPAAAAEHPACGDPFSARADASLESLQAIAATCADPLIRDLFNARAEHLARSRELRVLSGLSSLEGNSDRLRLEQSRIYTGLLEAFARSAWARGERATLESVTRGYADSSALMERAIKGRDHGYQRP